MSSNSVEFILNGKSVSLSVSPTDTLLDVLRDNLYMTGTKKGCGKGECGACTVLIDGEAVNSCLIPAMKVSGRSVETIEGIGSEDDLHPLQEEFVNKAAIQCGFCTPGMIMSAKALLDKTTRPTKEQVKEAISGNLCRCTGYVKIEEAVQAASEKMDRK